MLIIFPRDSNEYNHFTIPLIPILDVIGMVQTSAKNKDRMDIFASPFDITGISFKPPHVSSYSTHLQTSHSL